MAPPLLHLRDIKLTFGGLPLLEGAEIMVAPGERVCLVGRNGSGKSTLLKIAAGFIEADSGERFLQPSATLRYLDQEPDLSAFANVRAYVEAGLGPGDDPYRAAALLADLGLTGEETPDRLSGGEAKRAALARALAPDPDILLLDEPTNHLDLPAIEWLEETLRSSRSAIVLISHDRRFLSTLSRATVWLDRGTTRRLDQGFSAFEAWRDDVIEQEERDAQKLDRKIVAEEHWVRYGVTARRKRNVRRMRELGDLRQQRRDARRVVGEVKLAQTEADRGASLVIEAKSIGKTYGERVIVSDFSCRIARGDRLGIVGANGAGKTTLLSMLTGSLKPDSGEVRIGQTIAMVTLDQNRADLDDDASVSEQITGGRSDFVDVAGERKHIIGYMKDFLFRPEQARQPVKALSGGERARLLLARALATPSNLMVLDEPTNDLDLETLDLLQELVADYAGTVIVVSHDRDFLDRVATSILVSEGKGRWQEYAGGYSDMVAQRGGGVSARAVVKAEKVRQGNEAVAASPSKRKLSFKEKHALQTLPETIAALQREKTVLERRLFDPALFTKDPAGFRKFTDRITAIDREIASAEDEWLRLETLREEMEGAG